MSGGTCYFCDENEGKMEYHHHPIPKLAGGIKTVACCHSCHMLVHHKKRFMEVWRLSAIDKFPEALNASVPAEMWESFTSLMKKYSMIVNDEWENKDILLRGKEANLIVQHIPSLPPLFRLLLGHVLNFYYSEMWYRKEVKYDKAS